MNSISREIHKDRIKNAETPEELDAAIEACIEAAVASGWNQRQAAVRQALTMLGLDDAAFEHPST